MKNLPLIIGVAVIVGVIGFMIGMKYQQTKIPPLSTNITTTTQNRAAGQRLGRGTNGGIMRPTTGKIINVDDKSITVKMQDGSSKIILLSTQTRINKSESGTTDDLKEGVQVAVIGTSNSDQSVTATAIEINPQLGRFGNGRTGLSPTSGK
jgi:hypothetical protein